MCTIVQQTTGAVTQKENPKHEQGGPWHFYIIGFFFTLVLDNLATFPFCRVHLSCNCSLRCTEWTILSKRICTFSRRLSILKIFASHFAPNKR